MLGLTKEPDWWQDRYGPAPYTADNLVLWDDLEAGLVADPICPLQSTKYARPGLTSVIPTGSKATIEPARQCGRCYSVESKFSSNFKRVGHG
jgi:hypothetical protein